jgi:hypothetical protein
MGQKSKGEIYVGMQGNNVGLECIEQKSYCKLSKHIKHRFTERLANFYRLKDGLEMYFYTKLLSCTLTDGSSHGPNIYKYTKP